MRVAPKPALKRLRTLALAGALAVAALASFGPLQRASADGGNTITFTSPASGDTNHISFIAAPGSNQAALNAPTPSPTGVVLTSPVTITNSTADTGPTAAVNATGSGN